MRNDLTVDTPSLFSPEVIAAETPAGNHAREFVRWCWSLGDNFRNSPDATNFQFWMKRAKVKISKSEESEVLSEARRLFMKKVEQHVRRAAAAPTAPPA